ncbi:MAG TPA: class I adenylate-forming enzyme family protein [Acidimicrobiales bacterium]
MTDDAGLGALLEATDRLTGPGGPFEMATEDVLGVPLPVFKRRPRSLAQVLAAARSHAEPGDRRCMIFDDGTEFGFADIEDRAAAVAAWLRDAHGIGPGDRVAICAANSPEWLLTFWACARMGAVVVAMNGWWTGAEMRRALDLTEPKLVLMDAKRRARLDGDGSSADGDGPPPAAPVVALEDARHADPDAAPPEVPDIDEDDPAILLFTSGTTGRPKAAVLSHRSVVAFCMLQAFIGARAALLAGKASPGGTDGDDEAPRPTPPPPRLAVYPLFHVSGLGTTVTAMLVGQPTVWPLGRFDAGKVIELTKKVGIGSWGGTATHIFRLLDHPDIGTVDPAQLVQIGIGGSATTPELIRRTEERFPHLTGTFSSGYGSTESGGLISYATNALLRAAPDCVGPPLPGVEVAILDDAGRPVPDGEIGNVCARSALVMLGYWRHDEANAETLLPGRWLKTGDYGRMENGLLFVASRRRDLIIRGGENVYPFEIENRLEEHPDVDEVAVIGVDHPELGQEVRAVVVPRAGARLDEDELRAFCAETLASYKVPSQFEVRTEPLPRNASGKVLKHVLAADGDADPGFVEE